MKLKILSIILISIVLLTACGQSADVSFNLEEQLSLGSKYLAEAKYEEAIVVFEKIIKVEDKCIEAYQGLAQAYIGIGNLVKAIETLEKGVNKTKDESLSDFWNTLSTSEAVLQKIAEYCNDKQYNKIFELMQEKDYNEILNLIQFIDKPLTLGEESKKIGIYRIFSKKFGEYMIYYGGFQEGKREGDGVWLGYYDKNNYIAIGQWKDDSPNGGMEVREWHLNLDESVVYRVITGGVSNGLWDGPVVWGFERTDGRIQSWNVSFTGGKWNILREEDDEEEGVYYITGEENPANGEDSGEMSIDSKEELDQLEGIVGFVN